MNSNFEYYRIFYYVAKYGNLTKAASALQTSQPAVTRTIHKLEAELGCRLFIRSKSGMELTPEGKTFYEYVSAGCAQFFRGEQKITNLMSVDEGSITISATETALHCCLFQAIEAFRKIHPKVRFKILNNSSQKSIEVLKKGLVAAPEHLAVRRLVYAPAGVALGVHQRHPRQSLHRQQGFSQKYGGHGVGYVKGDVGF